MSVFLCPLNASAIRVLGRTLWFVSLALNLSSAAWAAGSENGCRDSNDRAAGCGSNRIRKLRPPPSRYDTSMPERRAVAVPEPSAMGELVLGIAGVGLGFVALRRRKGIPLKQRSARADGQSCSAPSG
jgi:hypothetical protein